MIYFAGPPSKVTQRNAICCEKSKGSNPTWFKAVFPLIPVREFAPPPSRCAHCFLKLSKALGYMKVGCCLGPDK